MNIPFQWALQSALNKGIAGFYDESSGLWERMWGEHMHHGYYPRDAPPKNNQQAQIDMIEEVLRWAGVNSASKARSVHMIFYVFFIPVLLCNFQAETNDNGFY